MLALLVVTLVVTRIFWFLLVVVFGMGFVDVQRVPRGVYGAAECACLVDSRIFRPLAIFIHYLNLDCKMVHVMLIIIFFIC